MDSFQIKVQIRVITPSEHDGKILLFIDDYGNIPFFYLNKNTKIDKQVTNFLSKFFYENDLNYLISTKQFSYIDNVENEVTICYNFLSMSTYSKIGSFVEFNQKSIELFRLANNKTL